MKIEILISCTLILSVLIGAIRINLFKKENIGVIIGLISVFSIGFGMYLWIKYGLILDYGTEKEIVQTNAQLIYKFGSANLSIGLLFIITALIKIIIWRLKNKRL